MAIRHLYLVRHGQYNQVHEPDDRGGGLTDIGRQQADLTAEDFARFQVSAVYSSSMRRAMETAERIAVRQNQAPQAFDLLREVIPIIPTGEKALFAAHFPHLTFDDVTEQRARAERAYERFFRPPPDDQDMAEIIVCHGNIIRYFVCKVLGAPIDLWTRMETNHCGVTHCTVEAGKLRLVSFNETGHLPFDLQLFT